MPILASTGVKIASVSGDTFILGAPLDGWLDFRGRAVHRNIYDCVVEDPTGPWERGRYSFDEQIVALVRQSVIESSAGGAAITPSANAVIYSAAQRLTSSVLGFNAGGAVTQLTSKATAVTLNKLCGQIVTHNASLAASTTVLFTVNNTEVDASDVIAICSASGGTAGAYQVWTDSVALGSFVIAIRNITAGALAEALSINFAVLKTTAA